MNHAEEKIIAYKLAQLLKSNFRSRFHLTQKDKDYINQKGLDTIEKHAQDFISLRLSSAVIDNDGKQTPMKGHPVFIAQHATGTCCRGCLMKWHKIKKGVVLTPEQQEYIVDVIMSWIREELKND